MREAYKIHINHQMPLPNYVPTEILLPMCVEVHANENTAATRNNSIVER